MSHAFSQRITHNFQNVTMPEALRMIERQSHYSINFIYNDLEDFRVSANVRRKTVTEAIRQLVGFYPIAITIVNDSTISVECWQEGELRYKGRVIDGHGSPIEFANITLLSVNDSSVIVNGVTNTGGYFAIPCDLSKVIVRVSYVGYKTIERVCSNPTIGTLRLTPSQIILKGVTVQGKTMKQGADRFTYYPSQDIRDKSQDAIDVMRLLNMPNLRFDLVNHSFSSLNNGNIQIRIDGVISTQQDLIAVQPQNIAHIEYINNPGVAYGDNVAAVILVKTRKNFTGIQGGARISQAVTTVNGNGYAYLNMTKAKDRYAIFLSESNSYSKGSYDETFKMLHYPDHTLQFDSKGEPCRQHWLSPLAQFDYTHSFADENFLNVKAKYNFSHSKPSDKDAFALNNGKDFYSEKTRMKDDVHNTSLDIYYTRTSPKGKLFVADLTTTYIATDYGQSYSKKYLMEGYSDYSNSYTADGHHGSVIGEVKYSLPVFCNKHRVTIGTRDNYSITRNDYYVDNIKNPSHLDVFSTYDYAEMTGNIGHLDYTIGGGIAYYAMRNDNVNRHYTFFRPNLSLYLPFAKVWSFQYSLGINPMEPSLSLLADVEQPMSEYEITRGNPNLKPYQAYANRLSFNFSNDKTYCALIGYVQYNADPYKADGVTYDPQTSKFVYGMANQGHFLHVQTQLYASQKLFKDKLSISAYGVMNHYENKADSYSNHYTAFLFGGSANYDEKNWGTALSYISPIRTLFNETKATQHANLQLSAYYKIKRWQFSMSINNPFMPHAYSQKSALQSALLQSLTTSYSTSYNNYVCLTVSYTFSKGKNKSYQQTIQNTDNDSGVMK